MHFFISLLGKAVGFLSRCLGNGHGSALPGLVVEKLDSHFLSKTLNTLPKGAVVVSGTNGKTTTTKIIVDLLRHRGLTVFTNRSGSNFTRGVISSALREMSWGKLNADIAVLELDEAYAVSFVRQVKPTYSLLLNVLRDQLDRFGEIDNTAKLLGQVAAATTDSVILNQNDPRIAALSNYVNCNLAWFGFDGKASALYKTDDDLHSAASGKSATNVKPNSIILRNFASEVATYRIDKKDYRVKINMFGIHNALNCAAALSVVKQIVGSDFAPNDFVLALAKSKPAFGRGEEMVIGGKRVRLVLVKNPSGFQLSLNSSKAWPTMIAINDDYADSRDVSWLYDVDFRGLTGAEIVATGTRGYDMALRLAYDEIDTGLVNLNIERAIDSFLSGSQSDNLQIFATYTAMLKIRGYLKKEASRV